MAAEILRDAAGGEGLAQIIGIRQRVRRTVGEVGPAVEDIGLQGDTKRAAVIDDVDMVVGDTAGAGIEILIGTVERAHLYRAAHFLKPVAATQGQAAAAGSGCGLQDDDGVALPFQFVGGADSGDTGAKDKHALASAPVGRGGGSGGPGTGVEAGHSLIGGDGTGDGGQAAQQTATGWMQW